MNPSDPITNADRCRAYRASLSPRTKALKSQQYYWAAKARDPAHLAAKKAERQKRYRATEKGRLSHRRGEKKRRDKMKGMPQTL